MNFKDIEIKLIKIFGSFEVTSNDPYINVSGENYYYLFEVFDSGFEVRFFTNNHLYVGKKMFKNFDEFELLLSRIEGMKNNDKEL